MVFWVIDLISNPIISVYYLSDWINYLPSLTSVRILEISQKQQNSALGPICLILVPGPPPRAMASVTLIFPICPMTELNARVLPSCSSRILEFPGGEVLGSAGWCTLSFSSHAISASWCYMPGLPSGRAGILQKKQEAEPTAPITYTVFHEY